MFKLIANENLKIFSRLRTWVLVIILIVATLGIAAVMKAEMSLQGDWKAGLQQEIELAEEESNIPLIPQTRLSELEQTIELNKYAIEHNFNPNSMWRIVMELSGLLQLITIFVVIIVGDIVAGEFTWGTIKLLLIRPVSRSKILLSKYMTTILFALFMMVVLFISAFLISGMMMGFSDVGTPHLYYGKDSSIQEGSMVANVAKTYALNAVELLMVVTIAFMISTVFRSSSMAIGFSIFILFAGQMIASLLLAKFSWGKFFLFANTDLSVYVQGVPKAEGMSLSFSIAVLAVYFVMFNFISWYIFNKRDVAA